MLVIDLDAFYHLARDISDLSEHYFLLANIADSDNSPIEAAFYRGRAGAYETLSTFILELADKHISFDEARGRLWATSISDR